MKSPEPAFSGFAYRTNADKSIDSICLACFQTAATAQQLAEVRKLEKDHDCGKLHCGNARLDGFQFHAPSNTAARVLSR
jgi:hypothetical protein